MTRTDQTKSNILTIRKAEFSDLKQSLAKGIEDFKAVPRFGLFFGKVYVLFGWALVGLTFLLDVSWAIYPLLIGFSLFGPFVATGLYEVSRRREQGLSLSWPDVLAVIWLQRRRELGWMAFVMLFVFWVWMYQVRTLVAVFFGSTGLASLSGLLEAVFTTQSGLIFLLVGHVVGAVISFVLYALTVISCPLLLDRNVDFVTAILTSIRTVIASPIVMTSWGLFVIVTIIVSAIPAFAGLLITLPILGHATWHLYRCLLVEN